MQRLVDRYFPEVEFLLYDQSDVDFYRDSCTPNAAGELELLARNYLEHYGGNFEDSYLANVELYRKGFDGTRATFSPYEGLSASSRPESGEVTVQLFALAILRYFFTYQTNPIYGSLFQAGCDDDIVDSLLSSCEECYRSCLVRLVEFSRRLLDGEVDIRDVKDYVEAGVGAYTMDETPYYLQLKYVPGRGVLLIPRMTGSETQEELLELLAGEYLRTGIYSATSAYNSLVALYGYGFLGTKVSGVAKVAAEAGEYFIWEGDHPHIPMCLLALLLSRDEVTIRHTDYSRVYTAEDQTTLLQEAKVCFRGVTGEVLERASATLSRIEAGELDISELTLL